MTLNVKSSFIVTIGQLVQEMKRADIHRQYGSISSIMIGFLERQFSKIQTFNIAMSFLFVCLSEAFKFLNVVTQYVRYGRQFNADTICAVQQTV